MKNSTSTGDNMSFLERILKVIKKYGTWNTIMGVMIFLLFGISVYLVSNIDNIFSNVFEYNMKKIEQEQVDKHSAKQNLRREISPKVTSILREVIIETGAERSFVLECHNGVSNSMGIPFNYADMTYEQTNGSAMNIKDEFNSVLLSKYTLSDEVHAEGCWYGTLNEMKKIAPRLASRVSGCNGEYVAIAALYDESGNEFGVVGFSYSDSTKVPEKLNISSILNKNSQKISQVFSQVVREEDMREIEK